MAYIEYKYTFEGSIEYEYKYLGNYGAKGEKRAPKKKATPEQVKKQNQHNREKRMRRLIKANFKENDLWCTLKYPKGTRKDVTEVKKDFKAFIRRLKVHYKNNDKLLKYIYRMEIGARGGVHIHLLCNRSLPDNDKLIQNAWKEGRVNYENLYDMGDFDNLAKYIVKQPNEAQERQLSFFDEEDRKKLIAYGSSRNLIRPEPEKKIYKRRTVRKLIQDGIKPEKGYYVDKNSIISGINPYTGMSYLYYTEVKIRGSG